MKIQKDKIASLLKEYSFIIAAYQFGSTVHNKEGPLSDLDIALLLDEERIPSKREILTMELLLSYKLEKLFHISAVDVITLNHQKLIFQHTVLRTGLLIYETEPRLRIQFAYKVIRSYLDFQPTLRFSQRFRMEGLLRRCGIR